MELRYEFGAKLFVAILLLLVVSDQLTSPTADPRDAAPPQPDDATGRLRLAALEEASLLLKLADRALPYANVPLVQAAAALGVAPSDTPQMDLSPLRRQPRRAARSDASSVAEPPRPAAYVAEAAAVARRSVSYAEVHGSAAAAAVTDDPTCHTAAHTGYSGDRAVVWGLGKPGFHLNTSAECCNACKAPPLLPAPPPCPPTHLQTKPWATLGARAATALIPARYMLRHTPPPAARRAPTPRYGGPRDPR